MITHRIGVDVCFARQRTFFHKCHRCIYRGQAANWEPADAQVVMINIHAAEEPAQAGVKPVHVPRKEAASKGKGRGKKAAPVAHHDAAGG